MWAGTGIVTRRPLVLQLMHTDPDSEGGGDSYLFHAAVLLLLNALCEEVEYGKFLHLGDQVSSKTHVIHVVALDNVVKQRSSILSNPLVYGTVRLIIGTTSLQGYLFQKDVCAVSALLIVRHGSYRILPEEREFTEKPHQYINHAHRSLTTTDVIWMGIMHAYH